MSFDVTSHRTLSGKYVYTFDQTAVNGTEPIFLKAGDDSVAAFFVESVQLVCGSGTSGVIYDGSAGTALTPHLVCASQTVSTVFWNFTDDPISTLKDSTGSMCVSGAATGQIAGMIKGYWGV